MNRKTQIFTPNLSAGEVPHVRLPSPTTHERLDRAFSRLQGIQLVRNHRQDRFFGKSAEERIIWRELLDLELQDVDEQIERKSAAEGSD
jgi:hypothetical protein